ncbi:hypothetical protein ACQF36_29730 [Streptomyces sp. Marseille-Q5077]|uniref:hypothetical protein n=1 Tax=Streptomyces sp. Marseille-Q5077 TaxID=3418995 RepID=UPI003D07F63E
MGTVNDVAPMLAAAAAAVGWVAGRGRWSGMWRFLGEVARHRGAVRTERERRAGLVDLVERLPPGGSLVVRQEHGGQHSMEVSCAPRPSTPARQDMR